MISAVAASLSTSASSLQYMNIPRELSSSSSCNTGTINHTGKDLSTLSSLSSTNPNDEYLAWAMASAQSESYANSIYIPTTADECVGLGFYWTITDQGTIDIAVAVHIDSQEGWVAVGFSETKGMRGADVVYFTTQGAKVVDAHIKDELVKPYDDEKQDWILQSYTVTDDGYLIFEATRSLNTYDYFDRPFVDDSSSFVEDHKIIGAWGSSADLVYHGNNRVRSSVQLFDSQEGDIAAGLNYESFITNMEARMDKSVFMGLTSLPIPLMETYYHDQVFTYNDLLNLGVFSGSSDDVYVIGYEFIIQPESVKYMHHIVMYGLYNNSPFVPVPVFAWTPGEDYLYFPLGTGVKLSDFQQIFIQYHVDNKDMDPNKIDTGSGVRLYVSHTPVNIEIGMLQIGDPFVGLEGTNIGSGLTRHTFECPSSCTEKRLSNNGITVISESLHMHSHGKRIVNEVIRDETTIHKAFIDFWDFDQSGTPNVQQQPFEVKRSDSFRTTCFFDGENDTKYGIGSYDEMCMAFLLYYPKSSISTCSVNFADNECSTNYLGKIQLQNESELERLFTSGIGSEEGGDNGGGNGSGGGDDNEDGSAGGGGNGSGGGDDNGDGDAGGGGNGSTGGGSDSMNQSCSSSFTEVQISSSISIKYKSNETMLTVEIRTSREAWLGFGVNPNGLMLDSDAVIGSPSEGVAKYRLENVKGVNGVKILDDERQTLSNTSFTQDENGSLMTFTKLLDDGTDMTISSDGKTVFIYAVGASNSLQRGHIERGSVALQLKPCSNSSSIIGDNTFGATETYMTHFQAHGLIAVLTFGIIMPLAILTPTLRFRLNRKIQNKELWVIIHMGLNITSYILFVILFGLAVYAKTSIQSQHFQHNHEIIGLLMFIVMTLQLLAGILRPHSKKSLNAESQAIVPSSTNTEMNYEVSIIEASTNNHVEVGFSTEHINITQEESIEPATPSKSRIRIRELWEISHAMFGILLAVLSAYQIRTGIDLYNNLYKMESYSKYIIVYSVWAFCLMSIVLLILFNRLRSKCRS